MNQVKVENIQLIKKIRSENWAYVFGLIFAAVLMFHRFIDGGLLNVTDKKRFELLLFGSFFYTMFAIGFIFLIYNNIKKIRKLK
jgi:hypothetical protein